MKDTQVVEVAGVLYDVKIGQDGRDKIMGWASGHIERLKAGETVSFRPKGNSMSGKIASGELVTVAPITDDLVLKKGDIVLCKVKGNEYLHLVSAVMQDRYQISNNHGYVNGWIHRNNIFGIYLPPSLDE